MPILQRTPHVLRMLLADMPEGWTTPDYGPGTWSAREIVAHLIHAERDNWIPRLRTILDPGGPRAFSPFDRAGHLDLMPLALPELLDRFAHARDNSLTALRELALTSADLARTGIHPAFGSVTAAQLLSTWFVHDLNHLVQICKAMAFQYRNAVGPWQNYLSILSPPAPR